MPFLTKKGYNNNENGIHSFLGITKECISTLFCFWCLSNTYSIYTLYIQITPL